jgi:hypothetical protein
MKKILKISLLIFLCSSCETKKLHLKTIENKDVKIEIYDISLITSGHQYVDLTDKYNDETTTIYKADTDQLTDVKMKNDTIFLYTKFDDMYFYELVAVKYDYTIQVVPEIQTKK